MTDEYIPLKDLEIGVWYYCHFPAFQKNVTAKLVYRDQRLYWETVGGDFLGTGVLQAMRKTEDA